MDITYYLGLLKGTILESFGIRGQFPELAFRNDTFEHVAFYIDCEVSTSDEEVMLKKNYFDQFDSDVSNILLYIKANLMAIDDVEYQQSERKLRLVFSNGYDLIFNLFDNEGDEPLNITLYRALDKKYIFINFDNETATVNEHN